MGSLSETLTLSQVVQNLEKRRAVVVVQQVLPSCIQPGLLSSEERSRADGISHWDTQQAFLAGRTLIRRVLGEFSDQVTVSLGPHGKPACHTEGVPAFNLSHAGGWVAAAFAHTENLGLDMECKNRLPRHPERIAEKFFSRSEKEAFLSRQVDFMTLWTRKEAVLKCMGTGFASAKAFTDSDKILEAQSWKIEHFEFDTILGAVCAPSSCPLIWSNGVC